MMSFCPVSCVNVLRGGWWGYPVSNQLPIPHPFDHTLTYHTHAVELLQAGHRLQQQNYDTATFNGLNGPC